MAVGGALRAAIRAGRFGVAGRESRRQARALASLNQGGPLGSRTGSRFPFPSQERGFDPARFGGQAFGESPRGAAVVVDSNTGRRVVLPQSFDDFMAGTPMARGPIAAPYEGVRTWNDPAFGGAFGPLSFGSPPAFMGRGQAPPSRSFPFYENMYDELPRFGTVPEDLIEFGVEAERGFVPYAASKTRTSDAAFMNRNIPMAFGGGDGPFRRTRPIPNDFLINTFDDIDGIDGFIDPQTGFRYTNNGFPLN